jgi:adenylate cyclase
MTDIILKHGGTIDKYMGDCIMAFWNAPFDDPAHASNACRAAIEMQHRLKSWNQEIGATFKAARALEPVRLGIGLNTGNCCVGNMGSDQRFDYSVLGDEVNLASRLEGLCKAYGVEVIIGANTYAQAMDLTGIEIDLIRVKGKTRPVHIYTLLGDAGVKGGAEFQNLFALHSQMLEAYRRQQWKNAHELAGKCAGSALGQKKLSSLYTLYRVRIEAFQSHAPAPDWDGVFTALTK